MSISVLGVVFFCFFFWSLGGYTSRDKHLMFPRGAADSQTPSIPEGCATRTLCTSGVCIPTLCTQYRQCANRYVRVGLQSPRAKELDFPFLPRLIADPDAVHRIKQFTARSLPQ